MLRLRLLTLLLAFLICTPVWAQNQLLSRQRADIENAPETNHAAIFGARTPCTGGTAAGFSCDGVDLLALMPPSSIGGGGSTDLNDIWGWTDPQTGIEYAVVGLENGTSFVSLADPENPVYLGRLPTHSSSSLWRDVKVYADHAFIVSEASNHGMQVFDLTQLRGLSGPPVTFSETAHYNRVSNAHNIVINEDTGFAYIVGSTFGSPDLCGGGLHMVNINTPTNPTLAGCFGGDGYTHDAQCVVYNGPDSQYVGQEICVASNEDTITIVDVTNKSNPIQISRTGYPQEGYTHQGWLTEDHRFFLLDDELDETSFGLNTTTRIWDVTDLDSPTIASVFTNPAGSIDHNQYVVGDLAFQSNYTSGLRILDVSTIGSPFEAGFFDTYQPSNSKSFLGTWSNYPFFESGVVIVSDITGGLFVLDPVLDAPPPTGLTLTCTPVNPPIVIGASGGSYQYNFSLVNNGASSENVDIWLELSGPGVGRTLGPVNRTLTAGSSLNRTFTQSIPGGAPAGAYTQTCNVGNFPAASHTDGFPLTKSASKGDGVAVGAWGDNFARLIADAPGTELPTSITLEGNYPNPFNPTTTIRYALPEDASVTLTVYNSLGQQIRLLVNGTQSAGRYEAVWDATNDAGASVPSGVYLYRLEAAGRTLARSMMLLK